MKTKENRTKRRVRALGLEPRTNGFKSPLLYRLSYALFAVSSNLDLNSAPPVLGGGGGLLTRLRTVSDTAGIEKGSLRILIPFSNDSPAFRPI